MYIIFPLLFEISIFVINIMLKENCGVSFWLSTVLYSYEKRKRRSCVPMPGYFFTLRCRISFMTRLTASLTLSLLTILLSLCLLLLLNRLLVQMEFLLFTDLLLHQIDGRNSWTQLLCFSRQHLGAYNFSIPTNLCLSLCFEPPTCQF